MPVKKAAIKTLRQDKKRALRNSETKENISYLVKKARKLIEAKDKTKAKEVVSKALKALDKAAQKGIVKKNTSARTKSRLTKKLNSLK